jgi:MFS family permease
LVDPGDIAEIERAIQLAIAPAFLLSGLAALINVLVGRLARVIDRERALRTGTATELPDERRILARRARAIYRAIVASVMSAILLCLLIMLSFIGVFMRLHLAWAVGALLVASMLTLIAALVSFLHEIGIASRHLPQVDAR